MTETLSGFAGLAAATLAPLGWLRGKKAPPRNLTPRYCANQLRRHGWRLAGAGPNFGVVYLDRGGARVALTTTAAERISIDTLLGLAEEFAVAEHARGRRAVAVYAGVVTPEAVAHAPTLGLTLLHARDFAQLEPALQAAEAAIAAHRQAERAALSRSYDPPLPAPLVSDLPAAAAPATAATPRLLGQTERVGCLFADRGGDILLVTFANQWMAHDGRRFMADGLAASLGVSVLGFVAATPNWYPPDDMARLVPLAQAALGERFLLRVAVGHSQGGHAALRQAGAFGARATLAFSPQFSIDPHHVPDARVNRYYAGHLHAGTTIQAGDGAGNGFVFFDPHDAADALHADRIAEVTGSALVAVPFGGHGTERGLLRAAAFPGLLAAALAGDAAGLRRIVARGRRERPGRDVQMALSAAQRHPSLAARLLASRGAGWTPDQVVAVAFRVARGGAPAAVLQQALDAAAAAPGNANVVGTAGLVALEAGALQKAARLVAAARDLAPHDPKFRDAERRLAARRAVAA